MSDIPQHVLDHLELREGRTDRVYLDTRDYPTAGIGHLLTDEEQEIYEIGEYIPRPIVDEWLRKDSERAWLASYNQSQGIACEALREPLFHVCYQLGAGWNRIHRRTWSLLKAHEWERAAVEATDSRWFDQTPIRVLDFTTALMMMEKDPA
jgi:hypothetical protein